MKSFLFHARMLVSLLLLTGMRGSAQRDSILTNQEQDLLSYRRAYLDQLSPRIFDINQLPINICFIKKDTNYVGFVVAGHAFKEVCHIASLKIKKILDLVQWHDNTIFSFGIGYDKRNEEIDTLYHRQMKELEETSIDLEDRSYAMQVRVSYVSDSSFQATTNKIRNNIHTAWEGMAQHDSLSRVIFRYHNINFPLPVPFYDKEEVISFTIPKSRIGKIPDIKDIYASTIKNALDETDRAIAMNERALRRLQVFDPITPTQKHGVVKYPVLFSNGIRLDTAQLTQFDSTKVVWEYSLGGSSQSKFYSISDLQDLCRRGKSIVVNNTQTGQKIIDPCQNVLVARELIREMLSLKKSLGSHVRNINSLLTAERQQLITLSAQLKQRSSSDTLLYIDAFLRGWVFSTGDPKLSASLKAWYNKRPIIWRELMARYPEYKTRLKTTEKARLVAEVNNIAGIFQFDDVFFSVRATDTEYIITPYKLLGNDFIQIIDRKSRICQFFSVNNFRQLAL